MDEMKNRKSSEKLPQNRKKGDKGMKKFRKEQPKQKKAIAEIEEVVARYAECADEVSCLSLFRSFSLTRPYFRR